LVRVAGGAGSLCLLIEGSYIDESLLDDDDQQGPQNPIDQELSGDLRMFTSVSGFSPADFSVLSEPPGPIFVGVAPWTGARDRPRLRRDTD
jgi:hypothetical protein